MWAKGDTLVCKDDTCDNAFELHSLDRIWIMRWRGWGIVQTAQDLIVLCPIHAGRQTQRRPHINAPLPGQQELFDLPADATVSKKGRKRRAVN